MVSKLIKGSTKFFQKELVNISPSDIQVDNQTIKY